MKPRVGIYLSEQMAARLAAAAKRPGTSKSALVEAALAQFLGADDGTNDLPVGRRLSLMSRQLEELDRGLRIVNETVALQARFHLAVTPVLPAADQRAACVLGPSASTNWPHRSSFASSWERRSCRRRWIG